jgi:hypothetical protein
MKVSERKGILDPRLGGASGVTPGGETPPAAGPGGGDQVSVSEMARELARLRAEVGDVEGGNERVAALAAAADRGVYVPDVRAAAEGLLREALSDLLS